MAPAPGAVDVATGAGDVATDDAEVMTLPGAIIDAEVDACTDDAAECEDPADDDRREGFC